MAKPTKHGDKWRIRWADERGDERLPLAGVRAAGLEHGRRACERLHDDLERRPRPGSARHAGHDQLLELFAAGEQDLDDMACHE